MSRDTNVRIIETPFYFVVTHKISWHIKIGKITEIITKSLVNIIQLFYKSILIQYMERVWFFFFFFEIILSLFL